MARRVIRVQGGGPAGLAAAIVALREGAAVELWEKSRLPRHKVCGEFLSPEVVPALEELGVWDEFVRHRPARIRRFVLHFRTAEKDCRLPEPGFGLSRYRFDQMLQTAAEGLGQVRVEKFDRQASSPLIIATGRGGGRRELERLFGFKAHFSGPADDAVELFFFSGCYVGVSGVEEGTTNVCGLGPESVLCSHGFEIDSLLHTCDALSRRLRPLTRTMNWLMTGPLIFQHHLRQRPPGNVYPAGDALSFVDPFTGTGILGALVTGSRAGLSAARRIDAGCYVDECRRLLGRPFEVATLFRRLLAAGWAERLVGMAPGRLLFRLTRPRLA